MMDLNGITPVDAYSTTQPTKNTMKMPAHRALPTPKQEVLPLVISKGPSTAMSIPSKVLGPITDASNWAFNSGGTQHSPPEESIRPLLPSQNMSEPFPDSDSDDPPLPFSYQELSFNIPSYFSLKPFDPSEEVKKVGKLMLGDVPDFHKVVNSPPVPTKHSVTANNSNARSYSATPPQNTNANIRPSVNTNVSVSEMKPSAALSKENVSPSSYSIIPTVLQKPLEGKSSASLPLSTIEVLPNGAIAPGDYKKMYHPWNSIYGLVGKDINRLIEVDFQFAGENGAFVVNAWKKDGMVMCKVPTIWTVTYREVDGSIKTVKMLGGLSSSKKFPSQDNTEADRKILWDLYLDVCAYNIPPLQGLNPVRKEAPFWGQHQSITWISPLASTFPQGTRNPVLELYTNKGWYSLPLLIPPKLIFYLGNEMEILPDTKPAPPPPKKPVPPEILQVLSKDDNFAENVNSLIKAQYGPNGGRDLYSEGMTVLNYLKSRLGKYRNYDFSDCEGAKEWGSLCFKIERLEDHLTQWRATGSLPKVSKYSDAYEFSTNYFFRSEGSYPNMGYMGEEDRKVFPKIMAIKQAEFEYLWGRPTVASVQNEITKWWKKGTSGQTKLGDVIWAIREAQESGVIDYSRMRMLQMQIPALREGIAWFNYACHNPVTYSGNYYYMESLREYNLSAYAEIQGRRTFTSNAYTNWQSQPMQFMLNGHHNPYCSLGTQNNLVFAKPRLPGGITQQARLPAISSHYVWMLDEQGKFVAPVQKNGILSKAEWRRFS